MVHNLIDIRPLCSYNIRSGSEMETHDKNSICPEEFSDASFAAENCFQSKGHCRTDAELEQEEDSLNLTDTSRFMSLILRH